ncbi:fimbrial biogenesis outer membrane usher protein [Stenotrophomonas sp. 169]|uniref:fimbria/pilus outer membrane usher protein n=1 Tax=Stenotrophomonas sp. 169 TaxID=2770322 RepID=UPI0016628A62|nr:fimbria/pilus outer membrane usher protein [Stenotrophomonas sp. 169]QNR97950.1 fimbrial biogenesis outer membrane usher protein [Stenotrophomonas sp. 169]
MTCARRPSRFPRACRLASAIVAGTLPMSALAAPNVEFNPQFLQGGAGSSLDLSRFERGDDLPGTYSADIKINGALVARRDVELRALDNGSVQLCLTPDIVSTFGVDPARLPRPGEKADDGATDGPIIKALPEGPFCEDIGEFIPQASARFDAGEQVLDVSIPQAYLATDPRGWVSRELWDEGINAARIGYNVSHQRLQGNGFSTRSTSATVNVGGNLGAWRFRHDGYMSQRAGEPVRYSASRSYAQRDIGAWGMQLTLGEAATRGDLFDSVNFRGVDISTDPRMLPDSQRDYAPVIRGVAQTNARVVVRQHGQVVYQASVAPGPFEISDLYGTSYGGDLEVEVTEGDGRVQRFVVPFAAVPQLLRAGQQRVSATLGTLNDAWLAQQPRFAEATWRRGLSTRFTGYAGGTAAQGYQAVLVGSAVNTRVGAFSGDITFARTKLPAAVAGFGGSMQGQSMRLTYSKDINRTGTTVSVAAYRYSTDGYLPLGDAVRLRQDLSRGLDGQGVARQRSRLDLTINQRLAERWGTLYASGSSTEYWNLQQRRTSFGVGYSNSIGVAAYSFSAQRSLESDLFGGTARQTNSVNATLTLPLGRAPTAPRFNGALTHDSTGRQDLRVGATGVFGEHSEGSYSGSATRSAGERSAYDANVGYQASLASLSAGVGHSASGNNLSLGASGGIVLHRGGVAFSQQLGDTIGLVHVPGAKGAFIDSSTGLKTDARGYAVVPFLTPYRRNEISVDPKGLPMDIELKSSSATTVPTAGAVVKMVIETSSGRSALIDARREDGSPLPFGLDVRNEAGDIVGVVGQASRLWVRGLAERGQLRVWLDGAGRQQCVIDYDLANADANQMLKSTCRSTIESAEASDDGAAQK